MPIKGKSSSNYVNDLRIAYLVERLKTDDKLCSLMVVDIGKEIGFRNTNSFPKASYDHTGVRPSYYMKRTSKNWFGHESVRETSS